MPGDRLYHLYVLQSVERGQADAVTGRTIPHEEVNRALRRKWLRGSAGSGRNTLNRCATRLSPTSPQDSHSAAERLLTEVLDAASSLDVFSERGRIVPEVDRPNVRQLLVQRYRLLYEVAASEVRILAFVHSARDLTAPEFDG